MILVKILRQTKINILIVMNATNILCLKNTWLDTHENKAHCMAKESPVKADDDGLEEDGKWTTGSSEINVTFFYLYLHHMSQYPVDLQTYY